jgi:hypothetical protein
MGIFVIVKDHVLSVIDVLGFSAADSRIANAEATLKVLR